MERVRSWEQITRIGLDITARWKALAEKHGLSITTAGLPSLTSFSFAARMHSPTRRCSRRKCCEGLSGEHGCVRLHGAHPQIVDGYFDALDPIFGFIKECEEGRDVMKLLKGPVVHAGFKRLN